MPMQLGVNPKSKDKGKGKDIQGKDKAKDVRNESFKKMKSDDRRKCLYCNETGHVRADCRQTARPCRGRRETGGSVATFKRRNIDRAVTVLTPRQGRDTRQRLS